MSDPRADRPARAGRWRACLAVAVVLALPLALAACGKRGPPIAPERRLPGAVQDLTATLSAEGVRLAWTLPKIRVDRSPLKDLQRIDVYRRLEDGPATEAPRPAILSFGGLFGGPTAMPGFDRIAQLTIEKPEAPAEVRGGQAAFTDGRGLTFGRRYTYVAGQSASHLPEILAYETDVDGDERFVLKTNGDIVLMRTADLQAAVVEGMRP